MTGRLIRSQGYLRRFGAVAFLTVVRSRLLPTSLGDWRPLAWHAHYLVEAGAAVCSRRSRYVGQPPPLAEGQR
jgi:hypothetical protein